MVKIDNYYQYFVDKGNHPDKNIILNQEKELVFKSFSNKDAYKLASLIIDGSSVYNKSVALRIVIGNVTVLQYLMDGLNESSVNWLERKEKTCNESKHSSYYAFLDNMDSHLYDYMISKEEYGLCGGSFPLIVKEDQIGTITVTGLRPNEDHDLAISSIRKFIFE